MIRVTPFSGPLTMLDELVGLHGDFNRLFRGSPAPAAYERLAYPAINVWQSESGLVVDAELPGVDPAGVDISVNDGDLVIAGERKSDAGQAETLRRQERAEGAFRRALKLPFRVQADRVTATYKLGVLRIELPRAEEDKPKRIAVQAA